MLTDVDSAFGRFRRHRGPPFVNEYAADEGQGRPERDTDAGRPDGVPALSSPMSGITMSVGVHPVDFREIALKMKGDGPANHVVRIDVRGPDGALPHYGAEFALKEGRGTYRFFTEWNDVWGEWELQATDVILGEKAVVNFEVK